MSKRKPFASYKHMPIYTPTIWERILFLFLPTIVVNSDDWTITLKRYKGKIYITNMKKDKEI